MTFDLYFPIVIPCLIEHVVTYFGVYPKLEVIVRKNMRLLSWREKTWSSLQRSNTSSNSLIARLLAVLLVVLVILYWVARLNFLFTSKLSDLLLPLGAEGAKAVNLDVPTIKRYNYKTLKSNRLVIHERI